MKYELAHIIQAGHFRSTSETPFGWRIAGGPEEAQIESWVGNDIQTHCDGLKEENW